ncbi:MAG: BLUF domain-containing protein [Zhongshania sp.]|uniref:BLUF domain-containing protein n=1 Tax=Zhongshania sp. TaxID=1971902 RepID=UPI002635596C|nr:BLUF domain-containing protein [Zhongshania sp.]MDF1691947.1 BLUF domain-containing protein [Zhongshania sp.]
MIFYLIYVSSAVKQMPEEDLLLLLRQSQAKNCDLDISGMLLYKGGNFMQMLEGDEKTVRELYATIKNDERHKNVLTIITGNLKERNFIGWSMGFQNMDKVADLQTYDNYIKDNLTLYPFKGDAEQAYEFISHFNASNR